MKLDLTKRIEADDNSAIESRLEIELPDEWINDLEGIGDIVGALVDALDRGRRIKPLPPGTTFTVGYNIGPEE